MTVYLLDVNLLIALSDPMHIHADAAHEWFGRTGRQVWATCPITENAFVRIISNPRYPNSVADVQAAMEMLRALVEAPGHVFWPDDISLASVLEHDALITNPQLTDVYLLGLALHHVGKLATLDQRIPALAVKGGAEALEIIPVQGGI